MVKDDKGKVKVKETDEPSTAKGAAVDGSLGLVIGIVLGGPVSGLLLGGALGAWVARKTDLEFDNEKIKSVEEGMPNGSSALFMQVQAAAKKEWLIALIRDSDGNVVELILDDTAEVEIEEQLAGYSGRQ